MGVSSWLFGEGERYNYSALCVPSVPWKKSDHKLNFYSKDEEIPFIMAMLMGLQHCFAMVGGLVTPPLVIFRFNVCGFGPDACPDLEQYAISAALITSGICSIINIMKIPIPFSEIFWGKKLYIGSGVLSVMGTSFTFLPLFEIAIQQMKDDGIEGTVAYGNMLGTAMVCCLLEFVFSLLPIRIIKKIFPPIVTAVTVMLIGVALTGTGMKYWGGGVVCAEMGWKTHSQVVDSGVSLPPPFPTCSAGNTSFYYGAPQYIGLGFSVICFLVVIEMFGSVFMKNCNVILALLFGYMMAGLAGVEGGNIYVNQGLIESAPWFTFLWMETFPIGFYTPAVIPMLIGYIVTTVETVGDISAVFEVSQLKTDTEEYDSAVQGGLLSDAINSILASLFTSMPNTTFSQNNGVISLTKCASRRAGIACGVWLILMGVLSKISGIITSIPDCVLGGMTIFLFANVLTSGVALTQSIDMTSRRNKFVLAMSLAFGVGVTVWPWAFQDRRASPYTAAFWTCEDCSDTMKGVRNGISVFLSTGYCVGSFVAVLLNLLLPPDADIAYAKDMMMETAGKEVDGDLELKEVTATKEGTVDVAPKFTDVKPEQAEP